MYCTRKHKSRCELNEHLRRQFQGGIEMHNFQLITNTHTYLLCKPV